MDWTLQPTLAGVAMAATAVAGGAPLFSEGLRVLRLRRSLSRLTERSLRDLPEGFAHVSGRVALESPLFAPLSGKPCAGFVLEVGTAERGRVAMIAERRPFRLVSEGVVARVAGDRGHWQLTPGTARLITSDEAFSERMAQLIDRSPEAAWLRRSGASLAVIERVLPAGASCHVVGSIHGARRVVAMTEAAAARTGTDDLPVSGGVTRTVDLLGGSRAAFAVEPDLSIDEGGSLEYLYVSDAAPGALDRAQPAWKLIGLGLGPILSLTGLLYLANAADRLRTIAPF
jgi:hypothetical protein